MLFSKKILLIISSSYSEHLEGLEDGTFFKSNVPLLPFDYLSNELLLFSLSALRSVGKIQL